MNQPLPERISLAEFLVWEQQQQTRHEWVDGEVVPCLGVSFEHGAIATNLIVAFETDVASGPCFVQLSDRQLVPRDDRHRDLGSFYADVFISCAEEDRTGGAAHFPKVVVEILSPHVGDEFTRKKSAYLGSRDLLDYLIVDSTRRSVLRYSWKATAAGRRLVTAEYQRGPVIIPALGLSLSFEQIYAKTSVPAIMHPVVNDESEMTVELD